MSWLAGLLIATASALTGSAQGDEKPILDRSPSEWTRAEAGQWKDWKAEGAPPENVQPFLLEAIDAYRQGHMPGALRALYALLDEAPEYPSALHQCGVIYFRLRRYGDAITAFERYLMVAPKRVGDTRALAHCYYTLGRYEEARAHYEKVLAVHGDSPEARRGYALCFMRLGDSSRALKELGRVLELDPQHANAATWIAQILFDEDRIEQALEAGQTARDLDPYEPRPWFLLSQIFYALDRDEEGDAAKTRFDGLTRIAQEIRAAEARLLYDPVQPVVYQRLLMLHRQAGNLRGVGQILERWLRVDPGRIETHIALLELATEMREAQRIERMAANLHKLAGDSIPAWQALVRHYAVRRDRVRQVEAERQLARLRARK